MQSIAGKSKRDARVTGRYQLDTRMLLEFAEAANGRLDQPDDSSLDWIEGGDYEEAVSPRDCYRPDEVISGLRWLKALVTAGDKTARDVWSQEWQEKERFSTEGFLKWIGHDLDGLIGFCERAHAKGEKVVGVFVP
jgi:hypothetical protein